MDDVEEIKEYIGEHVLLRWKAEHLVIEVKRGKFMVVLKRESAEKALSFLTRVLFEENEKSRMVDALRVAKESFISIEGHEDSSMHARMLSGLWVQKYGWEK